MRVFPASGRRRRASRRRRCSRPRWRGGRCFPDQNTPDLARNWRPPNVRCPDPPEGSRDSRFPPDVRVRRCARGCPAPAGGGRFRINTLDEIRSRQVDALLWKSCCNDVAAGIPAVAKVSFDFLRHDGTCFVFLLVVVGLQDVAGDRLDGPCAPDTAALMPNRPSASQEPERGMPVTASMWNTTWSDPRARRPPPRRPALRIVVLDGDDGDGSNGGPSAPRRTGRRCRQTPPATSSSAAGRTEKERRPWSGPSRPAVACERREDAGKCHAMKHAKRKSMNIMPRLFWWEVGWGSLPCEMPGPGNRSLVGLMISGFTRLHGRVCTPLLLVMFVPMHVWAWWRPVTEDRFIGSPGHSTKWVARFR